MGESGHLIGADARLDALLLQGETVSYAHKVPIKKASMIANAVTVSISVFGLYIPLFAIRGIPWALPVSFLAFLPLFLGVSYVLWPSRDTYVLTNLRAMVVQYQIFNRVSTQSMFWVCLQKVTKVDKKMVFIPHSIDASRLEFLNIDADADYISNLVSMLRGRTALSQPHHLTCIDTGTSTDDFISNHKILFEDYRSKNPNDSVLYSHAESLWDAWKPFVVFFASEVTFVLWITLWLVYGLPPDKSGSKSNFDILVSTKQGLIMMVFMFVMMGMAWLLFHLKLLLGTSRSSFVITDKAVLQLGWFGADKVRGVSHFRSAGEIMTTTSISPTAVGMITMTTYLNETDPCGTVRLFTNHYLGVWNNAPSILEVQQLIADILESSVSTPC